MQQLEIPKEIAAVGVLGLFALWQDIECHVYVQVQKLTPDNIYVYQQMYDAWCAERNEWKALYGTTSPGSWCVCADYGIPMFVQGDKLFVHRALLEPLRKSGVAMGWDKEDLDLVLYCIEDIESALIAGNVKVEKPQPLEVKSKQPTAPLFVATHAIQFPMSKEPFVPLDQTQLFAAEEMGKQEPKVEYPLEDGKTKRVYFAFKESDPYWSLTSLLSKLATEGLKTRETNWQDEGGQIYKGLTAYSRCLEDQGYHHDNYPNGHEHTTKGLSVGFGLYLNPSNKLFYTKAEARAIPILQQVWEEAGLMTQDGITYKMVAR